MRGPLCRALVLLALARTAVATTPAPTPASTCADEWGPLVGVTSRNMSFPTAQYTNLFNSEATARAQQRAPARPTTATPDETAARAVVARKLTLASDGWYDAGADTSCDDGCAALGLLCTETEMHAHLDEVDSSSEMFAVLSQAGVDMSAM